MLNIVLFGPPGAGKGTQSEKLITAYNLVHLSTGDILRSEIAAGTELGMEAKKLMDQGILVPDEVVIGMISSKLDQNKDAKGFIFDGFPRTTAQAKALDELLKEKNTGISMMLALEVSDEELTKRLLLRGKDSGRPDDRDEEVIRKRIEEYANKTAPLRDYYMAQNKYRSVHGIGTIDEIFEGLCNAINFTQSEKTPKTTEPEKSEGIVAKVVDMVKNVFSGDEKTEDKSKTRTKVGKAAPERVKAAQKPAAKKIVKPAGKAQVKPAAKKVIAKKKVKTAAKAARPAASKKKPAAKQIAAKKAAAKKPVAKKSMKKVSAKKASAKKVVKPAGRKGGKVTSRKPAAKKTIKKVVKKIAKKVPAKKTVKKIVKKASAKKMIRKAVKKVSAKKVVKKVTPKKAAKKTSPKKAVKKGGKKRR
ncbi:MAG: adenylate kinase [Bacteroidetes bacterium]|jgi:adenylate kinase|nr:adenylate kinase [Bacteroidota bacterium]